MHSVLENDKAVIESGKLLKDTLNMGHRNLVPELIF
jgi:hypothetical protein